MEGVAGFRFKPETASFYLLALLLAMKLLLTGWRGCTLYPEKPERRQRFLTLSRRELTRCMQT